MQVESLEVFRMVARLGSITGAARSLRFTQSAVSRQIAALEAELGAVLFDRRPRGVVLSADGRQLLPHVDAILDRLDAARRELAAGGGQLRIGAFPTAVAALVPRALADLRRERPGLRLGLVEGLTPALLERLMAGDADVVVVSAPPDRPIEQSGAELHHLLDEQLLVAVPSDHRLARRRTVGLADLADDSFVVGSPVAEDTLLRATLPSGFTPRIDIVAAEWTGKLGCVAAGLGVALLPALAIRAAPSDVVLLRLRRQDVAVRRVYAVTRAGRSASPDIAACLAALRRIARDLDRAVSSAGGPRTVPAPASARPAPSRPSRTSR